MLHDFLPRGDFDVAVIDEIGRMQLLLPDFQECVSALLDRCLLETIHLFDDPFTDKVKKREDVTLLAVQHDTRSELPREAALLLS